MIHNKNNRITLLLNGKEQEKRLCLNLGRLFEHDRCTCSA